MSETKKTFGEYLKELRLAKKASQGKLAAVIGKTAMYISNIEKGKNNPPDESQLEKIAIELELGLEERLEFLDKAAAARGTVAYDLIEALSANEKLRKLVRSFNAPKTAMDIWNID